MVPEMRGSILDNDGLRRVGHSRNGNEGLDIEGLVNCGLNIDGLGIAGLNNVGLDNDGRMCGQLTELKLLLCVRVATCNSTTASSIAVLLTRASTVQLWRSPATNNWSLNASLYAVSSISCPAISVNPLDSVNCKL